MWELSSRGIDISKIEQFKKYTQQDYYEEDEEEKIRESMKEALEYLSSRKKKNG